VAKAWNSCCLNSFCRSALDRRLVVALDTAYFALSVGIERWLYHLARSTRSGSQTARFSGSAST
jgi:plasmid replication initiation protein